MQYPPLCGREDIGKIGTAVHCLVVSGAGKDKLQGFVPLVSLDSISGAASVMVFGENANNLKHNLFKITTEKINISEILFNLWQREMEFCKTA